VLGGTFDPTHVGHVVAAVEARWALHLDRVLLVVAGDPWQKRGRVAASPEDRLALATAATDGVDGVEASSVEVDRPGPSVTADTLEQLAAPNMATWRRLEETRDLATIVVIERAGDAHTEPPGPGWRFERLSIPRLDVSSSDIRARLAAGRPVDGLVPPAVVTEIRARGLYTPS